MPPVWNAYLNMINVAMVRGRVTKLPSTQWCPLYEKLLYPAALFSGMRPDMCSQRPRFKTTMYLERKGLFFLLKNII